MDRNVGPEDRGVRVVVAIGLAVLLYFVPVSQPALIATAVFGGYLLLSGLFGRCIFYKLLGIDTSIQEQPYSTTDDRAGL